MRQRGVALVGVLLVCTLLSASILMAWLTLAALNRGWAQRQLAVQALLAAEAVLRDAKQTWPQAAPPPERGCTQGRCAWQGSAGLARAHWLGLVEQIGWGGCSARPAWAQGWPTLPGARLGCWIESTASDAGTLVRLTAWVQWAPGSGSLMQAVWLDPPTPGQGRWLSWREVMP
ncbi:MAG: pilus assembly PilX N-terminal domain-containing protein [Alphaproteobacteria bacterium]|nr:pilus assembly PilX N-terminal domain-containing protein [Alphaproteobacteria bacterium]